MTRSRTLEDVEAELREARAQCGRVWEIHEVTKRALELSNQVALLNADERDRWKQEAALVKKLLGEACDLADAIATDLDSVSATTHFHQCTDRIRKEAGL